MLCLHGHLALVCRTHLQLRPVYMYVCCQPVSQQPSWRSLFPRPLYKISRGWAHGLCLWVPLKLTGKGQGQGVRIAHLGLTFLLHMRGQVRKSPRTPLWFYKMNWMSIIESLEVLLAPFKLMLSPLGSGILKVSTSWRKAAGTWMGTMGKGWTRFSASDPSSKYSPNTLCVARMQLPGTQHRERVSEQGWDCREPLFEQLTRRSFCSQKRGKEGQMC